VNIVGIGGRTGQSEFAIGGAVNAALLNLTKVLADRGVKDGVRVNAINPGGIKTDRLVTRVKSFATEAISIWTPPSSRWPRRSAWPASASPKRSRDLSPFSRLPRQPSVRAPSSMRMEVRLGRCRARGFSPPCHVRITIV
jgi:NAD(P)-dependent dehydrogenase (short-subunit alcohol dehydrogenase family)